MNNTDCTKAVQDLKDDKVRGLSLRVSSKRKSFYLYYRTQSGVQRRPKLGDFPTMSVAQARDIAKDWLHRVAQGQDPSRDRSSARAAMTVKRFTIFYLWKHARKKKSYKEDRRQVLKYIRPWFGSLKISEVTSADIEGLHKKMKPSPVQANRTLSLLSKMFSFAEKHGERPQGDNPCKHIERYREKKRRRYPTKEEAAAIFESLYKHQGRYPMAVAFTWLLIYTGARPSEIANARPEDVCDLGLVLNNHKTDYTNEVRIIKLSKQARALISGLPETRNGTLTGLKSVKHLWEKVREDTEIEDFRIYDLRHAFASIGISHDQSLDVMRELLGHKSQSTTLRYAHVMDETAQKSVDEIGDAIDAFGGKLRVVN